MVIDVSAHDSGILSSTTWPPRLQHLLEVARTIFVTTAFDAVSIDAIVRAAGCSKETVYRHFPDKAALFRAALELAGKDFSARIAESGSRGTDLESQLAAQAHTILDTAADEGLLSALWVSLGIADDMPEFARELREGQAVRLEPLRELLGRLAKTTATIEDALDFGSLAVAGSALLMGFKPPDAATREAHAKRTAALALYGLNGLARCSQRQVAVVNFPAAAEGHIDRPSFSGNHVRNLLDVAGKHFLSVGFNRANLDTIAAEARVGRGTLYRHFSNKAGLFAASMRELAWSIADSSVSPPPLGTGQADAQTLCDYLAAALSVLNSPLSISVHRAVIVEARRDADLAREVHSIIREPWISPLSEWLQSVGQLHDPRWIASQSLVLAMRGNRLIASGTTLRGAALQAQAKRTATIIVSGMPAMLNRDSR